MAVVTLPQQTIDRFGYQPQSLDQNSTKSVVVQCDECQEVFVREVGVTFMHHCKSKVRDIKPAWIMPDVLALYMQAPVRLEYKILLEGGKLPYRKLTTDAGYDISSAVDCTVQPRSSENISTGIAIACPAGWYMTVEGRSGLGLKGIFPFRGLIDATYHNELKVVLFNDTDQAYSVKCGDRIAQLVIHQQYHADFSEVEDFSESYSGRGLAGFGSTGV